MNGDVPALCGHEGCRRTQGHGGNHDSRPSEAWDFFRDKDKKKIAKAGFATPRGGAKGAYQNHVVRSSKVIIPFERLQDVDLDLYRDGYAIRILPEQYFASPGVPKPEFLTTDPAVIVGGNAFILYRTHDILNQYPPMPDWQVRALVRDGQPT